MARLSDLLWGASLREALCASVDLLREHHPATGGFNQSGHGGAWGLLENAVLALDG